MDGPQAQSPEKIPSRSPVEEASREDLVKQVKRQLLLLQKAKAKCDELNKKCQERDGIIEELRKKCGSLEAVQNERDELQQAYLSLQGSQEQQFLSFQVLEDQLVAANEDAVKWRRKFQDCVEKLECTESKMTAYAQGTECMRDELKRLEEENKAYQQKVAELNEAERDARSTIANLREQLEQGKEGTEADLETTPDNLKQRIEALLAECETLKEERDGAIRSKESLSKELESVEVEKKEFVERYSKFLEERALLENQRDMKMNECNLLQEEKHGLEKQVSDLYQAKEDLEAKEKEFAKILDENSSLEKSMAEAMAENTQLQRSVNDMQEKIDKLTVEHEGLKREMATAKQLEEKSSREADDLRFALQSVEEKLAESIASCQMLSEELDLVRAQKLEAEKLTRGTERGVNGEASREAEIACEVETLTAELEVERRQTIKTLAENQLLLLTLEGLRKEEVEWKTEREQLEMELSRVTENYDALVGKLQDSAANMSALERRLEDSLQENHNVVEELVQVRDLQQFLEDEAKELHRECEKVKTEAKRLEADLENDNLHIQKLEQELEEAEIRERNSAKDLDALRCLVEELVMCIVELENVLTRCKGRRVECTIHALSKAFRKMSQLVFAAGESGLVDFNADEFVRPCLAIPSLLECLPECAEGDRQGKEVNAESAKASKKEMEALQELLSLSMNRVEELESQNKAVEEELSLERNQKDATSGDVSDKTKTVTLLEEKLSLTVTESEKEACCSEKQIEELPGKLRAKEELLIGASDNLNEVGKLRDDLKTGSADLAEGVSRPKSEPDEKEQAHCEEKDGYSQLRVQLEELNLVNAALEQEKNTLTQALALKESSGDAISKELEAKTKTVASLEQKLSAVMSESKETAFNLQKQIEELSATLLTKEELLNATSEDLNRIEKLCEALRIENANFEEEVSQRKAELDGKEQLLCEERSRCSQLQTQLDALSTANAGLLEEKHRLTEALASEQGQNDALSRDSVAGAETISSLEEKLATTMSESEERITILENQIEELSATLSSREEELKTTLEKLNRAEELGSCLKMDNVHLVEEIFQCKTELAEKERAYCEDKDNYSQEIEQLSLRNAELLSENSSLNEALEANAEKVNQLQENCTAAAKERSDLEERLVREISQLKDRMSALTADNSTKSILLDEIHAKLDDVLDRSESLQEELVAKAHELDDCKLKLDKRQNELNELLKELSQCKGQLLKLQEEQEKVWDVIYPNRPYSSEILTKFNEHFSAVLGWNELNKQLLGCIMSTSQAVASSNSNENKVPDTFTGLHATLTTKIESFCEEEADLFTRTKVEDIKLGMKVMDALRQLAISSTTVQNTPESSELESEDSGEVTGKMAELVNSLKERDEKLNKFKTLVVKLKRDLAEKSKQMAAYEKEQISQKAELDKQSQASKQAVQNFQSLQNEYDKLQDETEATKSLCKELETKLTTVINDLASAKLEVTAAQAERDRLKQAQEVLAAEMKAWEQCKADFESKLLVAESQVSVAKEQDELLRAQVKALEDRIGEVNHQLQAEKEQHGITMQQLEKVQKESKMQSLLHLEMADYERSVAELNAILKEKSKELASMKEETLAHQSKIASLTEHIKHLEEQKKSDDSKILALKEAVASLKESLGASRRHEEELIKAEVRLESDLKAAQLKEEEAKLDYAELSRKCQQLESSLRSTKENAQRSAKALESKMVLLREQLAASESELENTRTEFESYKVRVHTVLKQQKKSSENSAAENEANGKLHSVVEQLRCRVQQLVEELEAQRSELELAHEEYERLTARYRHATAELETREKDWKSRTEEALKKNTLEMSLELEKQLKRQHEKLASEFQKRLTDQMQQHEAAMESQNELVLQLRQELAELQQTQLKPPPQEEAFDISLQERQEGEGSECATSSISIPVTFLPWEVVPSSGFKPLEQLLASDGEKEVMEDPSALHSRIGEAHKKLNHMSELLNESESSNLRLTEQVRVLKEEIRRLERNKEREKHAENLEYLKNIILKFATLKGGSEKERLIPVLTTMLRLSPEEQKQLQSVVSGPGESAPDATASGWGGYLPRWPGLV